MEGFEIHSTKSIDRSGHDPMDSYAFALRMNELLERAGEARDSGCMDLAWSSADLGKYFILIRYKAADETRFALHITDAESDDTGTVGESRITFSPERGVDGLFGDVCDEVGVFDDDFGTLFDMAQALMSAYLDTYDQ